MPDLQSFAASLGLKVVSESFGSGTLAGRIGGRSFRLLVYPDAPTVVQYDIEPPLDLGLTISSKALGSAGLGLVAQHVRVGDSDWDDELWSGTDEAGRGKLFLQPDLRKLIIRLNILAPSFSIRDRQVSASHPSGDSNITSTIELFLQIAEQIELARAGLPAATPLREHARALESIAQKRGWSFSTTPLRLWGQADDHEVQVNSQRSGSLAFHLYLTMRSKVMRPFGLHLRKQTLLDGIRKVFGAQDIELGDSGFDRAFLVQAEDRARAKDALDEMARRVLCDFASRFDLVEWQNDALKLQAKPTELVADRIEDVLGAAEELTSQIARASLREARGPYR